MIYAWYVAVVAVSFVQQKVELDMRNATDRTEILRALPVVAEQKMHTC